MAKNRLFEHIPLPRVPKSVFNLSYDKMFTCNLGELIPVMCDEVVPGDVFKIGYEVVVRAAPMVAPIMHPMWVKVEYFFMPYRLIDDNWETIITGGTEGTDDTAMPTIAGSKSANGIADYLGIPPGVTPDGANWLQYPVRAYNHIYNEYYRDQTLQDEVTVTLDAIRNVDWRKDYFTSALNSQQRGTAPALPISGTTSADWPGANTASEETFKYNNATSAPYDAGTKAALENNTVDLSAATTFDVDDLRTAFQIQKWQERNARAGVRYTEFLLAHYGVSPTDARLDRPEFIGGSRAPIIISEVLQTSEDGTTPQGHLAGHGISVDKRRIGRYRVKEFGVIMGLMSIVPKAMYTQGIDRQWLREDRYDFYSPEFAHLSEQAILNRELFVTSGNASLNQTIFGYQGRYDEMRHKRSMVVGDMRGDGVFKYWNLARTFTSVPTLGDTFLQVNASNDDLKRNFSDETTRGWFVHFGNILSAVRPMPAFAVPGNIDHN